MKLMRMIKTGALASVLTGAMVAGVQAQTIELKVSHFLPPNHTFHKTMVAWGEQLAKESSGKLKLQIYPAGQLGGGPNRQFDAARNAISDIAISLHGATPGRYALTELVSLPYTSPSAGTLSAVSSRRLTELAPTYLAKEHAGLHILYMAVTPPLLVHSKVEIKKIEDFKGVKIRYAGANFKAIVEALGAVPLAVPPQETQDALAKGIVDAATFPYEGANSFRLGTVTKYGIEPAIASATFAVVMNAAKYNSLPADLKALIDKTTGPAAAEAFGTAWAEAETHGKAAMLKQGVQVIKLPDAEVAKMKKIFAPQIDDGIAALEKRGMPARKFYEAYTK
jgi:TRAP-type C4-dicarboxylate transport system substrate-binding protein